MHARTVSNAVLFAYQDALYVAPLSAAMRKTCFMVTFLNFSLDNNGLCIVDTVF